MSSEDPRSEGEAGRSTPSAPAGVPTRASGEASATSGVRLNGTRSAVSEGAGGAEAGARDPEAVIDEALLARFASGDQSAARDLTARHTPRALALAFRMLRDQAEAEDVAQEAMLRAWRIAPDWRPGGAKFSTWLHRVTLNLCYDRLRKKKGAPLEDAPEPEDPTPSVQAQLEEADGAAALRAALDTLPERQRAAIILRHYEERSNPEIAEALEVSVEAVESLLARGRRALRAALEPQRQALRER
ncbi:MAG: RNA polymerase sigma factor [Pseudomonadota bacterium]